MKLTKKNPVIEFFTDHTSCPNCDAPFSEFIDGQFLDHFERVDVVVFQTECGSCGAIWDDYYKLVGHCNLKVKEKEDEVN